MGAKVDDEGGKGSSRVGAVRNCVDEMQGHVG